MVCRVCGASYEACRTIRKGNIFRWQDVSCSPECGAEYLHRIRVSRGMLDATEAEFEVEKMQSVMNNDDFYGFDDEPDDEYINGFGSDE